MLSQGRKIPESVIMIRLSNYSITNFANFCLLIIETIQSINPHHFRLSDVQWKSIGIRSLNM